jgi:hypothetical protein
MHLKVNSPADYAKASRPSTGGVPETLNAGLIAAYAAGCRRERGLLSEARHSSHFYKLVRLSRGILVPFRPL